MPRITIRSKKEAVYLWLRDAIISHEIKPNSPLLIEELAKDLGVSHIPIREALQQLDAEGFVILKPYAPSVVTDIHPGLISEVFSTLEAMEVISSRLACQRMTNKQLDSLKALIEEMDEMIDFPETWSAANFRLHLAICDWSGTSLVGDILGRMLHHWDRLRRYYLEDVFSHRIKKAHGQHWEIYNALKARDADEVEAVIKRHNRAALTSYIKYLETNGYSREETQPIWMVE